MTVHILPAEKYVQGAQTVRIHLPGTLVLYESSWGVELRISVVQARLRNSVDTNVFSRLCDHDMESVQFEVPKARNYKVIQARNYKVIHALPLSNLREELLTGMCGGMAENRALLLGQKQNRASRTLRNDKHYISSADYLKPISSNTNRFQRRLL